MPDLAGAPADRALAIEGLHNVRDLGGLPRTAGGTTPRGVFVRAERPDRVTAAGWAALRAHGVRTVLDLRQPGERESEPVVVPDDLRVVHVDLDGLEDEEFWAGYWSNGLVGTPLYYLPHLARMPERTVAALAALADAPRGAVLLHCGGGRDRTGLISAVLLTVAGVARPAIVADYLATIDNAPALAAAQRREDPEEAIAAMLAERGTTSAAAFSAFLDGLDADALLARLTPAQASALRSWRGALGVAGA